MEPRFGHDFSRVRVHCDVAAVRSARAVDARAYTVGSHIVFGGGQFQPRSPSGAALLAHELTHTIQQSSPGSGMVLQRAPVGGPTAPFKIVSKVWKIVTNARGGPIVHRFLVVQIGGGPKRAFYFRTGTGAKGVGNAPAPGSWAPFNGIEPHPDNPRGPWLNKQSFYDHYESPELRGYGNQTNKDAADWLGTQEIPEGQEMHWTQAQGELNEALGKGGPGPGGGGTGPHGGGGSEPGGQPDPEGRSGGGTQAESGAAKTEGEGVKLEGTAAKIEGEGGKLGGAAAKIESAGVTKFESVTLKIGSFLEAALPGPQDVLFLWIGFFGSIAEAQAKLREEAYSRGFSEGLAANLLGLNRDWVNERLIAHVHGEEAEGFKGARAGGNNEGVVGGYRFAGRLTGEQRLAFWYQGREAARAKGDPDALRHRPFNLDDVVTLGIALQPTVEALLEVAREQEERRELAERAKYERAFGPRFRH